MWPHKKTNRDKKQHIGAMNLWRKGIEYIENNSKEV